MSKQRKWDPPKPHPHTKRDETRKFDGSSLRSSTYGKFVHRDYAAHWFRWQHALRWIKNGMRVIDVGCGIDQMMTRAICAKPNCVPDLWVGVDQGKIPRKTEIAWARVFDEFDFTTRWKELLKKDLGPFDVVSCFEVIEHMRKEDGRKLLRGLREVMKPDGVALISTPVYNEKHMAANHIHEYRLDELREEIERAGFSVQSVHGTFMTSSAIKRVATKEQIELVERLHAWYSWDVLANFLAPLYPEASSNAAWVLRKG